LEASAPSLGALLETMATGMFHLMADPPPASASVRLDITVESDSQEDLVVDVLAALLYQAEVDDVYLSEFLIDVTGYTLARIRAAGVDAAAVELTGAPIKAVTYHDLAVEDTGAGWYGRVYFDV
jgi:SHS2 domain-containing protein